MACTTAINRLLFLINFLDVWVCFRGFLAMTEPHVFLNIVFIWTINKKAFRLEGYVVCFVLVYTISCCLPCSVGILFFIFDLFITFLLPHHNKG